MNQAFGFQLPSDLLVRLDMITHTIPKFWERKNYLHFINQGPAHSKRVHQILVQLSQILSERNGLNADEAFIVSAAAWLYEIGMQSPSLGPVLGFEFQGVALNQEQLIEIAKNKHLLSANLILDSVRADYKGPPLYLGLSQPVDKYIRLIAEVCRWCSSEPLDQVPESETVNGVEVRIRLLVALLRLADQLYIDPARINFDVLEKVSLPRKQYVRWHLFRYVETMPITNGLIRFHYSLPSRQKGYLGYIRALIESAFDTENNANILYLGEAYHLNLLLIPKPNISFLDSGFQTPINSEILKLLEEEKNLPRKYWNSDVASVYKPLEVSEFNRLASINDENLSQKSSAIVSIWIDKDFSTFSNSDIENLVLGLAKILQTSSENVKVLHIVQDSLHITLEIPREQADYLLDLYLKKDSEIISLNIYRVEISDGIQEINPEFIDESVKAKYRSLIENYKKNFLDIEERMSKFIDPRSIPLDLEISRQEVIKKVLELEKTVYKKTKIDIPVEDTPLLKLNFEYLIGRLDNLEEILARKS